VLKFNLWVSITTIAGTSCWPKYLEDGNWEGANDKLANSNVIRAVYSCCGAVFDVWATSICQMDVPHLHSPFPLVHSPFRILHSTIRSDPNQLLASHRSMFVLKSLRPLSLEPQHPHQHQPHPQLNLLLVWHWETPTPFDFSAWTLTGRMSVAERGSSNGCSIVSLRISGIKRCMQVSCRYLVTFVHIIFLNSEKTNRYLSLLFLKLQMRREIGFHLNVLFYYLKRFPLHLF